MSLAGRQLSRPNSKVGFSMTVEGLKDLDDKLTILGTKVADRTIKSAGRYAMKPVLDSAKSNLESSGSVDTGILKDSIALVSRSARFDQPFPIEIGLKIKARVALKGSESAASSLGSGSVKIRGLTFRKIGKKLVTGGAARRWHFIEFGVPSRGIPARPFLRPAMDQNSQTVLTRFKERLKRSVDNAFNKLSDAFLQ